MRTQGQWRYCVLFAFVAAAVLAVALHQPIAQDTSYHAFADRRIVLGIPNFWNVVSNLAFLLPGIAGLLALRKNTVSGALPALNRAYVVFFVGAILICFGSAYYHLNPDNATLTWDRLPMTFAFMAFFAIIVGEHVSTRFGRRCLPLLVLLGISSVVYWRVTEASDHGDLRPYLLVQFLPMVLLPMMMLLFPSVLTRVHLMWGVMGAYAAAKVVEALDERIFDLGILSGHTLKHLVAGGGMCLLVLAVRGRRPIRIGSAAPLSRIGMPSRA